MDQEYIIILSDEEDDCIPVPLGESSVLIVEEFVKNRGKIWICTYQFLLVMPGMLTLCPYVIE